MTLYGYISKRYRCIMGPGNFEFPETGSSVEKKLMPLFPCYLEPQYPGQEPWGGVVPNIGMLYHHTEHIGKYGIEPLYLGSEIDREVMWSVLDEILNRASADLAVEE